MSQRVIRAAGGVLWRGEPSDAAPDVALVHRPRYDDWSLPKGKANPGEVLVHCAVREVREETGASVRIGQPLSAQEYLVPDGSGGRARKVASFWSMQHLEGQFEPSDEVDELRWLPLEQASAAVTADRDRLTLREFAARNRASVPLVLLRHATAGSRRAWPSPDRLRPLDATGRAQAALLEPVLAAYRPGRVVSADVARCLQTLEPYTRPRRLVVEAEPLLSESGYAAAPEVAAACVRERVRLQVPTVLCTQGRVIPDLLRRLCDSFEIPRPADLSVDKAGCWVLHTAGVRVVELERHAAPRG